MDLRQIAVPVRDAKDASELFRLLRDLHVPLDPCAGDPRFETDASGNRRLLIVVNPRAERALREAGRAFDVVRDLASMRDPRDYVSPTNRYADELARLRASKPRR
jgi:hypothetical protein